MVFMAERSVESRTRDRVRRAVGERGPITARDLASQLGLTPAAVRRHLDALEEAQFIIEHEPAPGPRRRGRPARSFVLTDLGQEQFANHYDDVATAALRFLEEHSGEPAVDEFAESQIQELEQRLRPVVEAAGEELPARIEALAQALSVEGFAASTRAVAEGTGLAGVQLCQGHCPVRNVATEFRQFCDAETEAISRLLGVHVQRLATLAGGEHVCTTYIPTAALSEGPGVVESPEGRSMR